MQFYYGDKTLYRILDEIEFWKRQEQEHTVVIRQLVQGLESQYNEALKKWQEAFARVEGIAVNYIETLNRTQGKVTPMIQQQVMELAIFSIQQSRSFIKFLNHMMEESEAVKENQTAIVVMNHIRRESEYFIGVVQAFSNQI